MSRICLIGQIQPKKHKLDHADYTAPTRQQIIQIIQIRNRYICLERSGSWAVGINDVKAICIWFVRTLLSLLSTKFQCLWRLREDLCDSYQNDGRSI